MNDIWLIYTGITVTYIVLLVLYFWQRSRRHELELKKFLTDAKIQLELHKQSVHKKQQQKMTTVVTAMQIMQQVAQEMDKEISAQYERLIAQSKEESELILKKARHEAEQIRAEINHNLDDYREQRRHEIESDLVKLVINVTQRVVGATITRQDHLDLIYKSLEEVKSQKSKM